MEETIEIAHHILDEHYKYYTKETIDDVEMVKELKFILKGIENHLLKRKTPKKTIRKIIDELKEYSKNKYVRTYISNIEEDLSEEDKKEEASYYFEYVFKHEEHPH